MNLIIFTQVKKGIFFILYILISGQLFAQCDLIQVSGRVTDTTLGNYFYSLMVVNLSTKSGNFGNSDGSFTLKAHPGDEILLSVKRYYNITFTVPKASTTCKLDTLFYIRPQSHEFNTVTIHPVKTLSQIKEDRRSITKPEKYEITGLSAIKSPITALYERFSKKAKNKRKVELMQHQDDIRQIVKELLRTYVSYDVVYLNEEQFNGFIQFLNINEHFLKTSNDYELIIYIQHRLEDYKRLHPDIFPKQ